MHRETNEWLSRNSAIAAVAVAVSVAAPQMFWNEGAWQRAEGDHMPLWHRNSSQQLGSGQAGDKGSHPWKNGPLGQSIVMGFVTVLEEVKRCHLLPSNQKL